MTFDPQNGPNFRGSPYADSSVAGPGWHPNPFNAQGSCSPGQVNVNSDDTLIPSGTYSGVDIRLIVHLPSGDASGILTQLQEAQNTADAARNEIDSNPGMSGSMREMLTRQITASSDTVRDLNRQLQSVQGVTKELAEVQTLSISTHREKFPVRPLGSVYPKSFCRGPRTLSGSMVWTVFHEHIFTELLETTRFRSTGVGDWDQHIWTTAITDQIPPIDITIRFSNEYGNNSLMAIMGVEFVNEGMVMSIEDLFVEGTAQWVARDIDLIRNITPRPMSQTWKTGMSPTGTRLLMEDLRRRSNLRRNPFL